MIPQLEKSDLADRVLRQYYQGSGTWTHTYFTKSYFKMPIKYLNPRPSRFSSLSPRGPPATEIEAECHVRCPIGGIT